MVIESNRLSVVLCEEWCRYYLIINIMQNHACLLG